MPTIRRRDVLKVVVITGAVGTAVAATETPANATSSADALVGDVRSVGPHHVVVETPSGVIHVSVSSYARLYSGADGEVVSCELFRIGDRVAVQGRRTPKGFVAFAVGSVFKPVHATVTAVSEDRSIAQTTIGPIELTAGRLPFTVDGAHKARSSEVTSGSLITGLTWTDPSTGQQYLMVRE